MTKQRDLAPTRSDETSHHVPGSTWGLPQQGSGAVASYGRRFCGLAIDWALAALASYFAFDYDPLITLVLFCAQLVLLHTLIGASIGQLMLGLRLVPVSGRTPWLSVRFFARPSCWRYCQA